VKQSTQAAGRVVQLQRHTGQDGGLRDACTIILVMREGEVHQRRRNSRCLA
jgi:hypothetical protein